MKKFFTYVSIIFLSLFLLVSCGKYKNEAGLYELSEIYISGLESSHKYEYYTIELKANGDCIIKSKANDNPTKYEAKATFDINEGKILVYTKNGDMTVTEEYYYDGETIVMDTKVNGINIYAKFIKSKE